MLYLSIHRCDKLDIIMKCHCCECFVDALNINQYILLIPPVLFSSVSQVFLIRGVELRLLPLLKAWAVFPQRVSLTIGIFTLFGSCQWR